LARLCIGPPHDGRLASAGVPNALVCRLRLGGDRRAAERLRRQHGLPDSGTPRRLRGRAGRKSTTDRGLGCTSGFRCGKLRKNERPGGVAASRGNKKTKKILAYSLLSGCDWGGSLSSSQLGRFMCCRDGRGNRRGQLCSRVRPQLPRRLTAVDAARQMRVLS